MSVEAMKQAYEVPLVEQLESVPKDARLVIDDADGMGTRFIPVGRMCHDAAKSLRQAIEQAEKQEPVACVQDLDEVKRKHLVYEKGMDWKDPLYTTPQPQREWVNVECPLCGEMAVAHTHPTLNKREPPTA
jgi:formylmethanofuran dehydrogenase subunit E